MQHICPAGQRANARRRFGLARGSSNFFRNDSSVSVRYIQYQYLPEIIVSNQSISAIKGATITPPVIGRISIGHMEAWGGGKYLPQMDDHFSITTLKQLADKSWEKHAISDLLEVETDELPSTAQRKLTAIPVVLAYNEPRLNVHSSYSSFETGTGRMLCTSDGENARRATPDGVVGIGCPRPEACEFGQKHGCRNMSRIHLKIEGQQDELGVFILRSGSWNSLNAISGRIAAWHGGTGGKIAGMPLMLELKEKTTAMSYGQPIYFADLVQRPGMTVAQSITAARAYQEQYAEAGFDVDGMERALLAGLQNSAFADQLEDVDEWMPDKGLASEAEQGVRRTGLKAMDSFVSAAASEKASKDSTRGGPAAEVERAVPALTQVFPAELSARSDELKVIDAGDRASVLAAPLVSIEELLAARAPAQICSIQDHPARPVAVKALEVVARVVETAQPPIPSLLVPAPSIDGHIDLPWSDDMAFPRAAC